MWNKYQITEIIAGHAWDAYRPYKITETPITDRAVYFFLTNDRTVRSERTISTMTTPPPPLVSITSLSNYIIQWDENDSTADSYVSPFDRFTTTVFNSSNLFYYVYNRIILCYSNSDSFGSGLIRDKCYNITSVNSLDTYNATDQRARALCDGTMFSLTDLGQKGDFVKEVVDASYVAYPQNGLKIGDIYYYEYKGEKTISQPGVFLGTVVSDSPDTYPDNGIHTDGYWYIKI